MNIVYEVYKWSLGVIFKNLLKLYKNSLHKDKFKNKTKQKKILQKISLLDELCSILLEQKKNKKHETKDQITCFNFFGSDSSKQNKFWVFFSPVFVFEHNSQSTEPFWYKIR